MAKQEKIPSYPCMMPPPDARLVNHPHDERIAVRRNGLRRILARLTRR